MNDELRRAREMVKHYQRDVNNERLRPQQRAFALMMRDKFMRLAQGLKQEQAQANGQGVL